MKKLLFVLLLLTKTVVVFAAGDEWTDGSFNYCIDAQNKVLVTGLSDLGESFHKLNNKWNITIPATTKNNKDQVVSVDGVKAAAFRSSLRDYAVKITSVTFPANPNFQIGEYAFLGCLKLATINNGNYISGIHTHAFDGCTSLTQVDIPNAYVGDGAFKGCSNLKYANIDQLSTLSNGKCFEGCTSLKRIKINNSNLTSPTSNYTSSSNVGHAIGVPVDTLEFGDEVTAIKDYAFYNSGIKCVAFNQVKTIGRYAFAECSELTYVGEKIEKSVYGTFDTFNGNLTNIGSLGEGAFYNCVKLKKNDYMSYINLSKLNAIPDKAFQGCTSLNKVRAEKATVIGVSAFEGCTSLTSDWLITSQENVTVNNNAFKGCISLTEMPLRYASSIGDYAFYGCTSLESAYFTRTTTIGKSAFENCRLSGKYGSGDFMNVVSIGENAFKGTSITEVELPNTLETIGIGAFPTVYKVSLNCPKLLGKKYVWDDNLFYRFGIKNSKSPGFIKIGDDVKEIGEYAFYGDNDHINVQSIEIGKNVETLGERSFWGTDFICKTFDMKGSANLWEDAIDIQCSETLYIRNQNCLKGNYLGNDFSLLEKFKYVKNIVFKDNDGNYYDVNVPDGAFSACENLCQSDITSLLMSVDGRLREVGKQAFIRNTDLVNIDLTHLRKIGDEAFKNCQFERVDISNDNENAPVTIGKEAFVGNNLKEITIHRGKPASGARSDATCNYISIDPTAFKGQKPWLLMDMSDQVNVECNENTKVITNTEAKANEYRNRGTNAPKYVTSIQRMECEPADVNMDHNVTIDDAAEVLKNAR